MNFDLPPTPERKPNPVAEAIGGELRRARRESGPRGLMLKLFFILSLSVAFRGDISRAENIRNALNGSVTVEQLEKLVAIPISGGGGRKSASAAEVALKEMKKQPRQENKKNQVVQSHDDRL